MKRKTNKPVPLDDLAVLAKLSLMPEWKVLERVIRTGVHNHKELIVTLNNDQPVRLAIDKSRLNGVIAGLLIVIKKVETAVAEMDKLAEK
jgi:hypothetical protein